ncbi:hypothetical protein C6Y14_04940 [Streptomyces dioscori]|uniref:Uncharacterized protein n=1 Tax=Streptomyces dioscori TaxID=2109333 RepID=A0A2P8QDR4_9ACTN|nr:hypothetical protein C6Y14_04940 [Streptomyces dioscori]
MGERAWMRVRRARGARDGAGRTRPPHSAPAPGPCDRPPPLVALGRVREERAGAGLVADALLRTSGRPWCPDIF